MDGPNLESYFRRNKAEVPIMQFVEDKPSSNDELSTLPSELDLPTTHKKGEVTSCTKQRYPILSPSHRAFASDPQNWREAFVGLEWKQAVIEEMKALSKKLAKCRTS